MATSHDTPDELQPIIISYLRDPANLCSLAGLASTMFAINLSILGIFYAAMIGMTWAVAFDWADGLIARRMQGRSSSDQTFGMQLDALIDVVNYGVAPAILLLSYGKYEAWFLPGAFIIVAASAIRLSYFNTFGLSDDTKYTGLALDNNKVFVFLFLFEPAFSEGLFSMVLYLSAVTRAGLNVSQIKTPKNSGNIKKVYLLTFYTLGITAIYTWKLL
ncbi:MAG: phosphatidylcholine/phosphatidylserine synthase [Congregibacter sp.]